MQLLSKNFKLEQSVRVKDTYEGHPHLAGKIGVIIGSETRWTPSGSIDHYIVLFEPMIGIRWRGYVIHQCHLEKQE